MTDLYIIQYASTNDIAARLDGSVLDHTCLIRRRYSSMVSSHTLMIKVKHWLSLGYASLNFDHE